jgi:hypothetical protein
LDLSIVEFLVYALITYAGILGLIVSAFRSGGVGTESNSLKIIWLIPCLFTAYILAGAEEDITLDSGTTTSININLNTTEAWQESITHTAKYTLINDVWSAVHFLFFIIILLYILLNIIILLTKIRK